MPTSLKVDRSTMVVQSLHDEPDDRRWWWARPALEGPAAIEIMPDRVWTHRYDGRLQRA
jgi:hypothetical protein